MMQVARRATLLVAFHLLFAALLAYLLRLQLWGFSSVTLTGFGAAVTCYATLNDYRPPGVFLWVRLVGGFLLIGLNFAGITIVFQDYRFDYARLILRLALFADTFIAGMIFGSATTELIASWWRSRQQLGPKGK